MFISTPIDLDIPGARRINEKACWLFVSGDIENGPDSFLCCLLRAGENVASRYVFSFRCGLSMAAAPAVRRQAGVGGGYAMRVPRPPWRAGGNVFMGRKKRGTSGRRNRRKSIVITRVRLRGGDGGGAGSAALINW
ncbi:MULTISPECIES: hypothetical protein [Cupriavidus]